MSTQACQAVQIRNPSCNRRGQNLNFAIPVKKLPVGLVQLLSEQFPGSGLPAATPAMDADFDSGTAFFTKSCTSRLTATFPM
jgi:hypothetical protein